MASSNAALLRAISEDRALGSAMLFKHRHEFETPPFHVGIMDLWRAADEFVLIEAFRGGAKTTLAEEFLSMEALYGNFRYCVIFGETYDKACQKLEAIAHEAKTNHKIGKLFGDPLAKKPVENKIWFKSGAMIQCAGWEQEVTGFKYLDSRPDRAYLDDVENLERVRDSDSVTASMQKIYQEILPAMDKVRRKIRVTQTPRAADCLSTRLRALTGEWLCAKFPICDRDPDDPEAESAWPDRYSMDWVRKERDRYRNAGLLREFEQEFLLTVDTAEQKPFREEMLRYIDIAPAAWLPRKAIYDPSRTAIPGSSARTGKVVVSRMGSKIIVHESGGAYWKPDDMREDIFKTWERHHCSEIGIEKNSLDEYLLQPLRFEMTRRGVLLPVKPLNAPQDRRKADFIMGLHPFFSAGDIVLVGGRGMHGALVAEMLNFPSGLIDVLNALAYSLRMFAGQPVYEDFSDGNVGPAPEARAGDRVLACFNASASETVCVALMRAGRHVFVARDWAKAGPITDACREIAAELRGTFPRARFEAYVPGEMLDTWQQRVPLVTALQGAGMRPYPGEQSALARGSLAGRIRTVVRDRRELTVDHHAHLTLAAFADGYRFPMDKPGGEPEQGIARLIAEAVECAVAVLDRALDNDAGLGNYGYNAQGVKYRTALPRRT